MSDERITEAEIAELERLCAEATPEPWEAAIMTIESNPAFVGRRPTAEEIGEYCKNSYLKSAEESGSLDFIFIVVEKPDGRADVCLVGNGPTSPANARLIAAARTALPKLLSERREREGKLAEAGRIGVLNQRNEVLDINVGVLTEQLTTASVKLGQEHTRAEAAEATLARVRELVRVWEGSDSDIYKPNAAIELREALTTLTVAPAPRVNERQQLEQIAALQERHALGQMSDADLAHAINEICNVNKENS